MNPEAAPGDDGVEVSRGERQPQPLEVWRFGIGLPRDVISQAQTAEAQGWDGLLLVDSQSLTGDCFIDLTRAAMTTERLMLGTGVTNLRTRHTAVLASCAASLQTISGGRFVLGVGRGDSSLASLGLAPVSLADFRQLLSELGRFLRGERVYFEPEGPSQEARAALGSLPRAAGLHWFDPRQDGPIPMEVYASGPRALALAGAMADRVTVAVGADPTRIAWAVAHVLAGWETSGRDGPPPRIGAYVNVVCHPDKAVAVEMARPRISTHARFSVLYGQPTGPVSEEDAAVLANIHANYDLRYQSREGPSADAVTAEFADRFAVLGPPDHCLDRLRRLRALGIDHFAIGGPSWFGMRRQAKAAVARLCAEVIPPLREEPPTVADTRPAQTSA